MYVFEYENNAKYCLWNEQNRGKYLEEYSHSSEAYIFSLKFINS